MIHKSIDFFSFNYVIERACSMLLVVHFFSTLFFFGLHKEHVFNVEHDEQMKSR